MKLALIGVGLIGGSFAAALRAAGVVDKVTGFDTDARARATGLACGVIDVAADSPAQAVNGADLIVIATPVGATRETLAEIAAALPAGAILTDVGSTKCSVIDAAAATLGPAVARFVPAHPIAGAERSGVEHADANLFRDRLAITTPTAVTDPAALQQVEQLWRRVGARLERLSPEMHDRVFAAVSHLPHLLAFALVEMIARGPDAEARFAHAGAGFRDFTRIAASSPEMWRDICIANRAPLADELRNFRACLDRLQSAVDRGDDAALLDIFSTAAATRRASGSASES